MDPLKYNTNLGEIDYHGIKIPVPNPIEDYLVERYGENWATFELTGENRWWLYSKTFRRDNNFGRR